MTTPYRTAIVLCSCLLAFVLCVSCSNDGRDEAPDASTVTAVPFEDALAFAGRQLERTVDSIGDAGRFPRFVNDAGEWETTDSSAWSGGFFAGCLWYMYEYTGADVWRERAERWTASMEEQKHNTANHNNGFMMMPPFLNGWRLTGNEHYAEVLLEAARSLATRYDPQVGMIKANEMEQWSFPVMVDTMVNIELLFWAAENGGDPVWKDMASTHALNTAEHHIREDGSTVQVVDFDPETGRVLGHDTLCGLSGDSAWMRGQGQALYGFTKAFEYTGDHRFLHAARRVADFFIGSLPEDHVPFWDASDPAIPDAVRDTSAGAVAVDGLLDLHRLEEEPGRKETYRTAAESVLSALASPRWLADPLKSPGILDHATWKKPTDPQADTSLIWGDYNLVESLMKYREQASNGGE